MVDFLWALFWNDATGMLISLPLVWFMMSRRVFLLEESSTRENLRENWRTTNTRSYSFFAETQMFQQRNRIFVPPHVKITKNFCPQKVVFWNLLLLCFLEAGRHWHRDFAILQEKVASVITTRKSGRTAETLEAGNGLIWQKRHSLLPCHLGWDGRHTARGACVS